jgi:peptidyl-prolyl cis-trans isomerase C
MKLTFISLLFAAIFAFSSMTFAFRSKALSTVRGVKPMKMGFFDQFFKPKKTASASHILVKGPNAVEFLTKLKGELSSSKNVKDAFAKSAVEYSTCPSGKKGGALGTFSQGQMVPAFDKVVFEKELGVIHGPVTTPFGYHLILIDERSE